jgi:hypothetical protein
LPYIDYIKRPIDSKNLTLFDPNKLFTEEKFSINAAVIPGYEDIVDMIYEYNNWYEILKKLMEGIERKGITMYEECKSPTQETLIILLKQKSGFSLFSKKPNITCEDKIYYELASHNFRIFIEEILQWNPFLNIPEAPKKPKHLEFHQTYGSEHKYKGNTNFKLREWWETQGWWTLYRDTLPIKISFNLSEESLPTPSREPLSPPEPEVTIESLKAEVERLKKQLDFYSRTESDNIELRGKISAYQEILHSRGIPDTLF